MMSLPPGAGSAPPGQKSFCTSTTIRAAFSSGMSAFLRGALARRRAPLQDALGAFEFRTPRRAQVLAAAVQKILNHPDAGPKTFRRHVLARHRARNLRSRSLERVRRWMRRVGGDAPNPAALTPGTPPFAAGIHGRLPSQRGSSSLRRLTRASVRGRAAAIRELLSITAVRFRRRALLWWQRRSRTLAC